MFSPYPLKRLEKGNNQTISVFLLISSNTKLNSFISTMARSFSPSVFRCRFAAVSLLPSSQTIFFRSQSSNRRSNRGGELNEIDTAALKSQSDPLIQKLEDAVHRIMVRRSAPDWLPFVPGASYWVPPPRSQTHGIAKLVEKLANPIAEEESLSISSVRGWPSSDYFIKGLILLLIQWSDREHFEIVLNLFIRDLKKLWFLHTKNLNFPVFVTLLAALRQFLAYHFSNF